MANDTTGGYEGGNDALSKFIQAKTETDTVSLGGAFISERTLSPDAEYANKQKKTRSVNDVLRDQQEAARALRKQKETRHEESRVAQLNGRLNRTQADGDEGVESIRQTADYTKDLISLIGGGGIAHIALDHALSPEEKDRQKQSSAQQSPTQQKPVAQPLMTQAQE